MNKAISRIGWFAIGAMILLILAASSPSPYTPWKAFRGTGGIVISTNPAAGTVNVDGSGISGTGIPIQGGAGNANTLSNLTVVNGFTNTGPSSFGGSITVTGAFSQLDFNAGSNNRWLIDPVVGGLNYFNTSGYLGLSGVPWLNFSANALTPQAANTIDVGTFANPMRTNWAKSFNAGTGNFTGNGSGLTNLPLAGLQASITQLVVSAFGDVQITNKLGVGTMTPLSKLDISNAVAAQVVARLSTISTNNLLELYVGPTRIGYWDTNSGFTSAGGSAGSAIYYAADGSTINFSANVGGNGTTTNSGGATFNGTINSLGNFSAGSGGNTTIYGNGYVALATANPLVFGPLTSSGIGWRKISNPFGMQLCGGDAAIRSTNNLVISGIIYATNGISCYASNLLAPTSITFPATTVPWTNNIGIGIEVYIDNSGVAGTAVKKNATTIFSGLSTDITIGLQPGESFSETYSAGTPAATWSPRP